MPNLKEQLIKLGYEVPTLRTHLRPVLDRIAGKTLTVFHGTSTKFLRTILKKGLIPDPDTQRWGQELDATRKSVQPVATLEGYVYFAKSGYYARDFAEDAASKFGGNPLVVVAQISPNNAAVDHDDLTGPVKDDIWSIAYKKAPDGTRDVMSWLLGYLLGVETAEKIRIGKELGQRLANYIGAENEDVLNYELNEPGVRASLPTKLLLMYLVMAHRSHGSESDLAKGYIYSQQNHWAANGWDIDVPTTPPSEWSPDERETVKYELNKAKKVWPMDEDQSAIEEEWRETIEPVSGRLGGAIDADRSRVKGIMIDGRINYRGSNRIKAIIEIEGTRVSVHYNAMGDGQLKDLIKSKILREPVFA